MKKELKYAILPLAIFYQLYSTAAVSARIPYGFEQDFKLQPTAVKFRNLDGSLSEPITVLSNFNTVKIDKNDQRSLTSIKKYLADNNVDADYMQDFINRLIEGVDDQSLCTGKLQSCVLYPETFDIVQNYNDREVYVFVSPDVLKFANKSGNTEYHAAKSKSNGVINSADLYVSAYNESDAVVSLNDTTVVGLPYGYFKTDFNLTNGDNDSQLYEAAYHLDKDGYTFKAGHFEYDPDVNSTDYLNNTARQSQNSVTFGTSQKLLVGGQNSDKVLSFYVPSSGTVKVLRDDRIIYQANVSEGQNSIAYNELPSGRYEATVEVTSSGQVVNSQVFQVYNSPNDTLTAGSIDYAVSAGLFSQSYYDYDDINVKEVQDDAYVKGLINYQITPSLQLGGGVLASESGNMFTVGGSYSLLAAGLVLEGVHSQFDDASHTNFNLGVPWFRVSYEALDNDKGDPLATHMYGYADYSRWSLNSSYNFGGGRSIYATYTRSDETTLNNNQFGYGNIERENNLLSIGYSTPAVLKSRLNLNLDYSDTDDETSISLLWSVPLSDSIEGITSLTAEKDGLSQLRTSLRKNELLESEDVNSSLEVANTYNRSSSDMYQELTLSADGSNDYARMNGMVFASTQDNASSMGFNAGISSTQVLSGKGVYITKDRSEAYALVDVETRDSEDEQEGSEKGYLTIAQEGKTNNRMVMYGDKKAIPLRNYSQYDANFDAQSVNLYNSGESKKAEYTHPGTILSLSPKVSRVVSFVSAFSDISDQPIRTIRCEGEGCLNVSEMTDSVYRVSVLEGMNFELYSEQGQCLLPYEFTSTNQLNFGQNYCLPIADNNEVQQIEIDQQKLSAVFLGAYENSGELKQSIEKLQSLGYQVIQKDVGKYKAVYIAHRSADMVDLLARHKEEIDSIKLLAKRLYKADSISYPLANIE